MWKVVRGKYSKKKSNVEKKSKSQCSRDPSPPLRVVGCAPGWRLPLASCGVLGDGRCGRVHGIAVDVLSVDILHIMERCAVLTTGVALLQAVEFDFWWIELVFISTLNVCQGFVNILACNFSRIPIVFGRVSSYLDELSAKVNRLELISKTISCNAS